MATPRTTDTGITMQQFEAQLKDFSKTIAEFERGAAVLAEGDGIKTFGLGWEHDSVKELQRAAEKWKKHRATLLRERDKFEELLTRQPPEVHISTGELWAVLDTMKIQFH